MTRGYHWWTETEDEILCSYYKTTTMEKLMSMLPHRTQLAIVERARILRLQGRGPRFRQFKLALIPQLTEAQAGYIAGLFDGEGTVSLTEQTRWAHPVFSIANCDQEVLLYVMELLNKYGGVYEKQPQSPRHRICYIYKVASAGEIEAILTAIQPYVRIKRRQVTLILEYFKKRKELGPLLEEGLTYYTNQMRTFNFPSKAPRPIRWGENI